MNKKKAENEKIEELEELENDTQNPQDKGKKQKKKDVPVQKNELTENENKVEKGKSISEENEWEDELHKKLASSDMKKHIKKTKREEFKAKIRKKKEELNAKTSEIIEGQFMKVLDKRVLPYTILFIIFATLIGISTFIFPNTTSNFLGKQNISNFNQFIIISLTVGLILGNIFLFWASRNEKLHKLLFVRGGWWIKIIVNLFVFLLGYGLCIAWWNVIDPRVEADLNFLTFQGLFGLILALVYFLWNAGQIFFVKTSIEKQSIEAEAKFQVQNENVDKSKKLRKIAVRNYLFVFIPLLIHIIFILLYIFMDTQEFYLIFTDSPSSGLYEKFTPATFFYGEWKNQATNIAGNSDFVLFLTRYFPEVWFANDGLLFVLIWSLLVLIIWIFLISKQISLYKMSKKNETPNVFSSTFFLIFSIFLYLKFFAILNTGIGMIKGEAPSQSGQIVDWITSVILMIITIFNLLRGFGKRIKTTVKSPKITKYNLVFLMFLLVASYWGGQWSLITGEGLSKSALSIATSLIVVCVYIGFYYWYSRWILERRGFIRKRTFTLIEVKEMLTELSRKIKDQMLQTIENEQLITNTLNQFMLEKKIILGEGTEEESLVQVLEEEEHELTSEEKLAQMQRLAEDAQLEIREYKEAVEQLKQLKEKSKSLDSEQNEIKQKLQSMPEDLTEQLTQAQKKQDQLTQNLQQQKLKYEEKFKELKRTKPPKEPKEPKTPSGEVDEDAKDVLMKEFEKNLNVYSNLQKEVEKEKKALTKTEENLNKQNEEINKLKEKIAQQNEIKAKLESISEEIKKINETIPAIEKNLEYLKWRSDLAEPVVEAAKIALKSAEKEYKKYQNFTKAQKEEKEAEEKLTKAQQVHEMTQEKLEQAQEIIDKSRKIPEIDEDIVDASDKIAKIHEEIKTIESDISQKKKIKAQKQQNLEKAQEDFESAKKKLNDADELIKQKQKEVAKITEQLEKGESLKAEYSIAQDNYNAVAQQVENAPVLEKLEEELNNLLNHEKELKTQLKQEKKSGSKDIEKIDSLKQELDDIGEKIKDKKSEIKEVKELRNESTQSKKKMEKLAEQQMDLEEIQANLKQREEELIDAENARLEPKKEFDKTQEVLDQAQDALAQAKNDLKLAQAELKVKQEELNEWENNKANLEKEREIRLEAEKNLEDTKLELENAIKLLNEAKDNYSKKQEKREKQEIKYLLTEKEAELDFTIYQNQNKLKEAHYILKQAMRQAEANVELRKERVVDAEHEKAVFLEEKEKNPDQIARNLKKKKIEG